MLREMQHCKKQTNEQKKKKKLKPPKSGGKKEAQTINKELFGTLNKTENNFFSKRWKTLTSGNTTKPPPEKITHTQRYSLHNTAEHALPKDSIRQYRISNSISLLECFCAKFWKAMTRITDSKYRAIVYVCGPTPAYFSSPKATNSH